MSGTGYYSDVVGFDTTVVDVAGGGSAYGGASGGTDTANLYDAVGSDTFYAGPTKARMAYSAGKTIDAAGFGTVNGRATSADSGSTDKAYLYGFERR